eukprot:COSAG04_NODE_794_length_10264_cov_35.102804_14_plen_110_part_00
MDVDEVDNTTHAPAACNLSAPALCAPTMGYYGGGVWRYPAAGNGSYHFMLPQRLWHWEGAAQGWHEPVSRQPPRYRSCHDMGCILLKMPTRYRRHLGCILLSICLRWRC